MTKTVAVSLLLLATGCASWPASHRIVHDSPGRVAAGRVRTNFERLIPDRFETLESVVIDYGARSFAMLGYLEVDVGGGTIAFAAFTPSGVKIAEARSSGRSVDHSFALEKTLERFNREKLARGIVEAIRRVYFDRIPTEAAEASANQDRFVFRESFGEGSLEFIFAGPRRALIEKSYKESGTEVWKVSYGDYISKSSRLYPSKIVLEDRRREFRLTITLKRILS